MNIKKLEEIINKINTGGDAAPDFRSYLENDLTKASYSKTDWPFEWRKKIYAFGSVFSKTDAAPYLKILDEIKGQNSEKEVFDFIFSEIIWNFFETNNTYIKDEFHELIKKYPLNPEFHHSYAHFLENNGSFAEAIFEAKLAYKIDSENSTFIYTYFYKVKRLFDHLLLKDKLEEAKKLLTDSDAFTDGLTNLTKWEISNKFSILQDRLHDYEALGGKVEYFERQIQNTVKIEERKLIEILGIFSAIIAFILTNITISIDNHLILREVLFMMLGMALVLIIFILSISFIFGPRYRYANFWWYITRPKLWAIVVLFLLLAGMFYGAIRFSI